MAYLQLREREGSWPESSEPSFLGGCCWPGNVRQVSAKLAGRMELRCAKGRLFQLQFLFKGKRAKEGSKKRERERKI